MHRKILERHGWSIVLAVLLSLFSGGYAQAAPGDVPVKVAIAAPLPNSLVAGRITLSVAFDAGFSKVSAFTVMVDDMIHTSKNFIGLNQRGIQYLEFDTRAWPDGNHTVKIVAMGARGALGADGVDITIRNGLPGGPDLVPPLVQIRNFQDGDTVSGKIKIDILAEDNVGRDLLLSLFVNRTVRLLKSSPPYFLELDTAPFLDPKTGTGTISLEAWAFDKAENLGKSRALTLNVVPGNGQNTPVKPDPTKPITTGPTPPMANVVGPKTITPDMGGGIIIDLKGPNSTEMPRPIPSQATGNAAGNSADRIPGSRPGSSAISPQGRPVAGDFAPVGGEASGKPAGSKTVLPGGYRPDSKATRATAQAAAPQVLQGKIAGGGLGGARLSPPSNRPTAAKAASGAFNASGKPQLLRAPAPAGSANTTGRLSAPAVRSSKPTMMAKADIVLPRPTANGASGVSVELPAPMASPMRREPMMMPEMPGAPVPVPLVNPTLSPSFRSAQPGVRIAKTPAQGDLPGEVKLDASDPMIVVVDTKIKPNSNGRIPVQVYKLAKAPLPREQSYRVSRNDTLDSLARKFRVTPKSIMVANGITGPSSLKSGSIVKIPGSFDVVVNHKRVAFDVAPRVENGLPLAPFRQIFEHSGGVVVWYGESQEVRAASETKDVKIKIGSKEARVNQMVVVMEKEAFIDSGRTIVPMSFLEKALDMVAEYDVRTRSIHLVKK